MAAFQNKTQDQLNQQVNIEFNKDSRPITMNKLKVIGANIGK